MLDPMAGCCHECGAEDKWIGSQWLSMPRDLRPLHAVTGPEEDRARLQKMLKHRSAADRDWLQEKYPYDFIEGNDWEPDERAYIKHLLRVLGDSR
jgi:hypothetical protein